MSTDDARMRSIRHGFIKIICGLLFLALVPASQIKAQSLQFGDSLQYFPQFAAGAGWTTWITMFNPTPNASTVAVELFRSDGSTFIKRDVFLNPGETANLRIDGLSQLIVGWARLSSTGRFNATLLTQFSLNATVLTQAGVLPAEVIQDFRVIASVHSNDLIDTGLAIANPSLTNFADIRLRRLSASGTVLDTKSISLGPFQHVSRFLNEAPFFEGIDNYDGTIEVSSNV